MNHQAIGLIPVPSRLKVVHMPNKRVPLDVDKIVRLYESGHSLKEVAAAVGSNYSTVSRRLAERGVRTRTAGEGTRLRFDRDPAAAEQARAAQKLGVAARRRSDIDTAAVIAEYTSGDSLNTVGDRHGTSHDVIRRILRETGVPIRGQSAAGIIRASREDPAVKSEKYRRIGEKARGRPMPPGTHQRSARTKHERMSQRVGRGEMEVAGALRYYGFEVDRQVAVGNYNLDIVCLGVDVEIHTAAHGPHLGVGRIHRRIDDLTNAGWRVLYVWCPRGLSMDDLEEVVRQVKIASGDPATPGQYRMLRCEGEFPPARGGDAYKGAYVLSTGSMPNVDGTDNRVRSDA